MISLTETKEERVRRLSHERNARWRKNNPQASRDKSRRWRERNPGVTYEWPAKRINGAWVKEYKETTPCLDCGLIFEACCMDFDHVRGEKVYAVGTMVAHGHNRQSIEEEIAKCDLVCANCHRMRTRDRRST